MNFLILFNETFLLENLIPNLYYFIFQSQNLKQMIENIESI